MDFVDIFKGDAFTLATLTQQINRIPYKPAQLGKMGLFETEGVTKHVVYIEERDGVLQLIPVSARGTPGLINKPQDRRARNFTCVHLQIDDSVLAAEVADIRAFGSQDSSEGVAQVVARKIEQMRNAHEVTLEWQRLGAIKGTVYDVDGVTVINDLYKDFGIYKHADVDFDVDTVGTDQKPICMDVVHDIEDALGMTTLDHVHALCGREYYANLIANTSVVDAYEQQLDGAWMRETQREGFLFGGIFWEEYKGTGVGDTAFIATDEARIFPVGVPGLFKTYFAPADFMETVNTVGLPFYAKQELMDYARGINITTESNPLNICTRPTTLIRAYY